MEFLQISEAEFAQFSIQHENANFWQSTSMAHLREWNGWTCVFVGVKELGTLCAASMISYRSVFMNATFAQAVRGFYLDYTNKALLTFFQEHLVKYLKSINCMYFKIDPYVRYKQRDMDGKVLEGGFDHQDIVDSLISLDYVHMGFLTGNDNSREPNWMFVSDIKDKTEEQLLKEFDHQTRWSINKALKTGIKVRELTKEELPSFKKIMDHTASRRGFVDHNLHYYEGLFETFGNDGTMKILLAQLDLEDYKIKLEQEKQGAEAELMEIDRVLLETPNSKKFKKKRNVVVEQISLVERKLEEAEALKQQNQSSLLDLAAATFITFGKEVMYLYSGAYDEYMKFNGAYAIQWNMFQHALKLGAYRYNFYGISGDFRKDAEDYGIYEFKKGFTGNVEELIGDFYLYLQPGKYRLYEALRKVKHILKK